MLEQTVAYDGHFKIIRYRLRHRLFAGGISRELAREVFERGHAVAVLPFDPARNQVVLIDPGNGRVKGRVDLTGLLRVSDRTDSTDVLNGIAYDAERDRLFVTGKLWPKVFEIRLRQVD